MFVFQTRLGWLLVSLGFLAMGLATSASAQEHTKDPLDAVKKAVASKKAVLIDVREKAEWDQGHLKDARLLPLSSLKENSLPKDLSQILPKDTPRFHLPPIRRTLPSQPPKNPPAANAVANRDMPVIHAFVCRPSGSNTRFPLCPSTAITVRQRCRQQPAPTTPSLPGTNTPNFPKRPPSSLSTKGTPAPELAVVTSAVR
jgi:hypothetical protein